MSNEEILNRFGELLITRAYDPASRFVNSDLEELKETARYKNLFANMTAVQKEELEKMNKNILEGIVFDFLKIFEENEEFKIIHEADGQQTDLVKISEMLKAEPIIEGGWIERFSRFYGKGDTDS